MPTENSGVWGRAPRKRCAQAPRLAFPYLFSTLKSCNFKIKIAILELYFRAFYPLKKSMSPKKEDQEFNALKKMGFEFEAPQDEFSYQPDSGSTANGPIGKQEYGIDVDSDAALGETETAEELQDTKDLLTPIPGESSWSQEHRQPQERVAKEDKALVRPKRKV